jgi:hypothetical protein
MKSLTFAMKLRQMSALPKVLMLCQRLGGTVTYLSAADGQANLVLLTPRDRSHRFAPQLRRLVDVTTVTELHVLGVTPAQPPRRDRKLRTA